LLELTRTYFEPLADFEADTLILGCTDLTCVRDIIDEVVSQSVTVVDPAEAVVQEARRILEEAGALKPPGDAPANYRFLITGDNLDEFASFTCRFLGVPGIDVTQVPLLQVQRAGDGLTQKRIDPA
jgi:glutamate racemase